MKNYKSIFYLIVSISIVCSSCASHNDVRVFKTELPKDLDSAEHAIAMSLPLEISYKIATNEITKDAFHDLIVWFSDKWKVSETDSFNALLSYKEYLLNKDLYKKLKFVSYYERSGHFEQNKYLLDYSFTVSEIPKLNNVRIKFSNLPKITLEVSEVELDFDENLDRPDDILETLLEGYNTDKNILLMANGVKSSIELCRLKRIIIVWKRIPPIYYLVEDK